MKRRKPIVTKKYFGGKEIKPADKRRILTKKYIPSTKKTYISRFTLFKPKTARHLITKYRKSHKKLSREQAAKILYRQARARQIKRDSETKFLQNYLKDQSIPFKNKPKNLTQAREQLKRVKKNYTIRGNKLTTRQALAVLNDQYKIIISSKDSRGRRTVKQTNLRTIIESYQDKIAKQRNAQLFISGERQRYVRASRPINIAGREHRPYTLRRTKRRGFRR